MAQGLLRQRAEDLIRIPVWQLSKRQFIIAYDYRILVRFPHYHTQLDSSALIVHQI